MSNMNSTKQMKMTAKVLAELQLAYPRALNDKEFEYYCMKLCDIPPDILQGAINIIINKSNFFPSIAEIRKKAKAVYNEVNGITEISAGDAWEMVEKAVRSWGYDRGLDTLPPTVKRAAKNVGWRDLCYGDSSQRDLRRAHFLKIYSSALEGAEERVEVVRAVEHVKLASTAKLRPLSEGLKNVIGGKND